MSSDEAHRIARRIARRTDRDADRIADELASYPEPITASELDGAIAFARSAGAAPWLIRLLEAHRRDDAAGADRDDAGRIIRRDDAGNLGR